jgi:DNA-directed RNA polymerase specialized sigma24 family protein
VLEMSRTGAPDPRLRPPVGHAVAVAPDLGDAEVLAMARRIYRSRFAAQVEEAGIDAEDGLQEVLMRLFLKSQGASRWNPERGGLSTWLFVATGSIVLNIIDKHRRYVRRAGTPGQGEDAAMSARAVEEDESDEKAT